MTKNFLSFLSGVLLVSIVFLSYDFYVKNTQKNLLSKEFIQNVGEISHIVEKYKKNSDVLKTQENLLKTFVASYEDPFTSYISKEESLMFDTMIGGDFEGIGAYIEDSPNGVFIQ